MYSCARPLILFAAALLSLRLCATNDWQVRHRHSRGRCHPHESRSRQRLRFILLLQHARLSFSSAVSQLCQPGGVHAQPFDVRLPPFSRRDVSWSHPRFDDIRSGPCFVTCLVAFLLSSPRTSATWLVLSSVCMCVGVCACVCSCVWGSCVPRHATFESITAKEPMALCSAFVCMAAVNCKFEPRLEISVLGSH